MSRSTRDALRVVPASKVRVGSTVALPGWGRHKVVRVTTDNRYREPRVNLHLKDGNVWQALRTEQVRTLVRAPKPTPYSV